MIKKLKGNFWKIALTISFFGLVILLGSIHPALADTAQPNLATRIVNGASNIFSTAVSSVGYDVIGHVVFAVSWVIAMVAGIAVTLEAWLVGIMLNINTQIFQSAIVQDGFSITLAVANLGFVLGIIIIALATILRSESYGAKKILFKLIAAAILVNFSLVIIAPIVGVANGLTNYFVNCVAPANGGCGGTGGFTPGDYNKFAVAIAGAFNPQNGFVAPGVATATTFASATQGAFSQAGSNIAQMVVPITSLVFLCAGLIAIVITLGALVLMLLMRYLYISILAILMPFAWLSWVFPSLSSNWGKWWQQFIRWTFFPPIVVFFLYLGVQTAASMANTTTAGAMNFAQYTSNSNVIWASISNLFSNIFSPVIQTLLNQFVLVGVMMGGLFAANALGIKFADTGMKAASGVANGVVGYVGKQTKKGARATFNKFGGGKVVQKMRTGVQVPPHLQGIPQAGDGRIKSYAKGFLGGALNTAAWATNKAGGVIGRNAEPNLTSKEYVDEAKKGAPDDTEKIKQNLKNTAMPLDQVFGHLAKLLEKGKLGKDTIVGNEKAADFLDSHRKEIGLYGFGKYAGDADKVFLSTLDSRNAERAKARGEKTVKVENDIKDDNGDVLYKKGEDRPVDDVRMASERQLFRDNPKADFSKADANHAFGGSVDEEEFNEKINSIVENGTHLVPNLLKNMNDKTLERFADAYNDKIVARLEAADKAVDDLKDGDAEELKAAKRRQVRAKAVREGFRKSYGNIFGNAEKKENDGGGGGGGDHK